MNFKFKYIETLTLNLNEWRVLRASVYQTVSMSAVLVINGSSLLCSSCQRGESSLPWENYSWQGDCELWGEISCHTHALKRWQCWVEERRCWVVVFIERMRHWIERKHGEISFYMTFLRGHRYFLLYLYRVWDPCFQITLHYTGIFSCAQSTFTSMNNRHHQEHSDSSW